MSSLSLSTSPGNNHTVEARLSPPQILPKVKREQHKKLEERFKECRNPNDIDLMLIAAEVGLSEIDTKVWKCFVFHWPVATDQGGTARHAPTRKVPTIFSF